MPHLERGGVRIAWESRGAGTPAILLMPPWSIVRSRAWKLQVPELARRHRVLTFDGRGSGDSARPIDASAYAETEYVADALAVLDAAGVDAAVVVGWSMGATRGLLLAAQAPERVLGLMTIGAATPLVAPGPGGPDFEAVLDEHPGWAKWNRRYWQQDYRGFLEFFMAEMFSEPHSTKQIEDAVAWGLETGADTLTLTIDAPGADRAEAEAAARAVRCPVLALHGDRDGICPHAISVELARLTGGELVTFERCGHGIPARDPVRTNALISAFAARFAPPRPPARWRRAMARPRRALYVSSPIGLGHARRDLAIARALREAVPGLEVDWLAQEPTRTALAAAGERVHPLSGALLGEAAHVDAWAGDHELWVFECLRAMDEILLANYMVFREAVRASEYDVWIGDEAWELDHFLHENPEDKRAPFVWLTDFVGLLPLPGHGEREAFLAADLNAEMVEHVERFPWIRDRALFVGDPEDVVGDAFGPGLPVIREWTERHFEFTGQIVPAAEPLSGEGPLCVVAVGGSGVGGTLLRTAADALPLLRERVPGARMHVVAGPRLDPAALPAREGLTVTGYDPDLDRRLAGCDVALVQGGMTTGLELIAAGRPFVSVPLRRHFEQLRHVRHRLERHGHERCVHAGDATPERLAEELAGALATAPAYREIAPGGAERAAALIAELL